MAEEEGTYDKIDYIERQNHNNDFLRKKSGNLITGSTAAKIYKKRSMQERASYDNNIFYIKQLNLLGSLGKYMSDGEEGSEMIGSDYYDGPVMKLGMESSELC